jgi:hypothetical protein
MSHRFSKIRRFRFNLPQRIAAIMLALFVLQGFWLVSRQTLTDLDYQYARCGRETWEKPSPLAGYFTSCGNIHDGILAYRLAGLPLSLALLAERGFDRFRKPENRVVQQSGAVVSTWELRHQITHVLLLLRLPFLFAGFLLGGCIWWVTRRLYGNFGGYMALALYCFSPAILKACVTPDADVLAALGAYGGIYTCIGVAHAMQGPAKKWRPRIVLLTLIFGTAAAAHIVALPVAALLGLAAMIWVAEGHRSQCLPVILAASLGALLLLFACYDFSPDAFSYIFRSGAAFVSFSADPARRFFSSLANGGITIAVCAAAVLYFSVRRSRYFGNTVPLFCAVLLIALVMTGSPGGPWLWSLPFLLTFVGGVFADAFESPRGRLAIGAAASIVFLQIVLCLVALSRPA